MDGGSRINSLLASHLMRAEGRPAPSETIPYSSSCEALEGRLAIRIGRPVAQTRAFRIVCLEPP